MNKCELFNYELYKNSYYCRGCGKVIGIKTSRGIEIYGHGEPRVPRVKKKGRRKSKNENMSEMRQEI